MTKAKILAVATGSGQFQKSGWRTGLWLGELTHFQDAVEEAGFEVVVSRLGGGEIPIDPESLMLSEMATAVGLGGALSRRYADRAYMDTLANAADASAASHSGYAAIYLAGGHGAMFDFFASDVLAALAASFFDAGKVVSAVCHGPAGLLRAKLQDGSPLLAGRQATGFSWAEEIGVKRTDAVPFSLEEKMKAAGADYGKALIPFASHVVEDGLLITGQNPASAADVGEAVAKSLCARLG